MNIHGAAATTKKAKLLYSLDDLVQEYIYKLMNPQKCAREA